MLSTPILTSTGGLNGATAAGFGAAGGGAAAAGAAGWAGAAVAAGGGGWAGCGPPATTATTSSPNTARGMQFARRVQPSITLFISQLVRSSVAVDPLVGVLEVVLDHVRLAPHRPHTVLGVEL